MRILILEDDLIAARSLRHQLEDMGYDPLPPVSDAAAALALARAEEPHVCLLDIRIGTTKDGVDVARLLRAAISTAVIFVTAHGDRMTLARAGEVDPDGYLVKPVSRASIFAAVELAFAKVWSSDPMKNEPAGRNERSFATTIDYITSNLASHLTTQRLAKRLGMSPSTFVRRFEEATGVTPRAHIAKLRIEEAKRRLCSSDEALTNIAEACGFSSQAHLSNVFKQFEHITPGKYRRRADNTS